MKLTCGKTAKKGMRVVLTKASKGYSIGESNPLVGTEWECTGKIVSVASVLWANGNLNCYRDGELTEVGSDEGVCVTIW